MNKKHWLAAILFLVAAGLFLGVAWLCRKSENKLPVHGDFAFAQTRDHLKQLGRIQVITEENGEINIYRRDGLWYFKEAKDYFVNIERLSDFFNMISTALIVRVEENNAAGMKRKQLDAESGTTLRTYDLQGKLLDQAIVGARIGTDSVYMRPENSSDIDYVVGPVGAFSGHPMDWIPYPLLAIEHNMIDSLTIKGRKLNRNKVEERILRSPAMRRLILALQYLDYVGLVYKNELMEDKTLTINERQIEVGMVDGLIYVLKVYEINGTYWLAVELTTDKISRLGVKEFVEQNQKYYVDWLFQLTDEQGKILFNL